MQFHINDLETSLYHNQWQILERQVSNEFDISEIWVISHLYYPNHTLAIVFEGLGDLEVLPIEQSYACYILENKAIELYFSKHNKNQWKQSLMLFINQIFDYAKSL